MIEMAMMLYAGSLALTLILNITGVSLGQSRIGKAILKAGDVQPQAQPALNNASIIAMAISETSCILSLTLSIILIFKAQPAAENFWLTSIAQSGIIFALGLSGFIVSFCSALPAIAAANATAQQPFFASKIRNVMLLTMSIIQTPAIFGFIIMLLISLQSGSITHLNDALRMFAAALCIGLGAVGPIIGQGLFAKSACYVVGINRSAYNRILSFALLSQTLIETPIIMALIVALLLLITTANPSDLKIIALIVAALCQSVCNIAPGISSGRTSAAACIQIGKPESDAANITRTCLLAQGLIDTFAIYGLLVSILLIFKPM
jgi:F-type H+-transporting ATPase subunit c